MNEMSIPAPGSEPPGPVPRSTVASASVPAGWLGTVGAVLAPAAVLAASPDAASAVVAASVPHRRRERPDGDGRLGVYLLMDFPLGMVVWLEGKNVGVGSGFIGAGGGSGGDEFRRWRRGGGIGRTTPWRPARGR